MEDWRKDARREPIIVDLDALVPKDHLLRKIEKIMDYEWLYERLEPYYCHDNGRPGTDPVVLIKMVLLQHLFGIPSLRQTYREIQVNNAYAQRKETIERVFADAKEKHAMRYTHHRGLAAVTRWVRLKYAAMNLKKLANWSWRGSIFRLIRTYFSPNCNRTPAFAA